MKEELISHLNLVLDYYKDNSNAKIRVFTKKNKKYKEFIEEYNIYYNTYKENINVDLNEALREYKEVFLKNDSYQFNTILNDLDFDNNILDLVIKIHVFFRLFRMKPYNEKSLNNINDIISYREYNDKIWYRGQTNTNWQLVPSFFRDAKNSFLWTWPDIYKDYDSKPQKVSLIKKLNEVDINTKSNPYKTAAFIQHSIGYSPLIDFTRSPQVAISFALSNGSSMVNYYGDNACVFVFKLDYYRVLTDIDEINNAIYTSKTQIYKRNESILYLLKDKMWIDLILNKISNTVHLINRPTNDRMIFQKGTFVLYDNVIIIGDEMYMSYNKSNFMQKQITKYNIDVKNKENIYENLMITYPQYHQRYLLNPYLYLTEADK